jgi:hypothetical protein
MFEIHILEVGRVFKCHKLLCSALSSGRFHHRFHRFKLHRLTRGGTLLSARSATTSHSAGIIEAVYQGLTLVAASAQPQSSPTVYQ